MSELHAVQETRGSKCVSIWEKQSGGLFRSECINPSELSIIEQGTHDELIAKGGFYHTLYNSQFAKVSE